jgi:carbon-monoxide dehydrogenase large subunit
VVYDTGDYEATLNKALELANYADFPRRKAEAKAKGKLRGIGIAAYIEACGIAPSSLVGALGARAGLYEAATVRVNPTGSVTVLTGSHSHGQGHETTFAQVVADKLGIGLDQIDIVHGDTARVPYGMGTYGSRSLAVGGTAIVKALDKIIEKGRKIAAHLLEASESDIVFENGAYTVKGTDKSKAFGEIALTAYVPHKYPIEPPMSRTNTPSSRWSRVLRRPRSMTRRISPSRPEPIFARLRSTPRRVPPRSCLSLPPTISAMWSTQ